MISGNTQEAVDRLYSAARALKDASESEIQHAEVVRDDAVRAALKAGVSHKKIRQITDLPIQRIREMRPPVAKKDPAPAPMRVVNGEPRPGDKPYVAPASKSVRAIPSGLPGLGKRR